MFEQAFKNIDDVLWKDAGCTSELDYTEQSSWLLFLEYLDALETEKAMEAELAGKKYNFILDQPYRWESWAAPKGKDGHIDYNDVINDLAEVVTALDLVFNLTKNFADLVFDGVRPTGLFYQQPAQERPA